MHFFAHARMNLSKSRYELLVICASTIEHYIVYFDITILDYKHVEKRILFIVFKLLGDILVL